MKPVNRREFSLGAASAGLYTLFPQLLAARDGRAIRSASFVHPGMLHSAEDIARMRRAVRRRDQPIYAGFEALRDDAHSQATYKTKGPFEEIGRNPTIHVSEFDSDANAAYQCAVMGHVTGDPAYFRVSSGILDAWSSTLKRITGADAVLCASLGGFKIVNAAELLRYGNTGWPVDSSERFAQMLKDVFVPVLVQFAPFANGNWDTAAMKTLMAISIYTENEDLFERVLQYYLHGCGDGSLEHYIYASGQCQESGRDQQHTQLGLAHLGDCCEMAWHQGLDLYGVRENRLLAGFEYTAKYILGGEVPFTPDLDQTGKYMHQVISARSEPRPVYEQIYNHYVKRRGLAAAWTERAAIKIRPERAGFGADHTGFGTLLYTRPGGLDLSDAARRGRPAGLFLSTQDDGPIDAEWIPLARPSSYRVLRASGEAPYERRAESEKTSYSDTAVKPGELYSYKIEVKGGSGGSLTRSIVAGLPKGWDTSPIGPESLPGTAAFDGSTWRLSAGAAHAGAQLQNFFAVTAAAAKGTFTGRVLPMFASQSLHAGLALLDAADDSGPAVFLLLVPAETGDRERAGWAIRFYGRHSDSTDHTESAELKLSSPNVMYGRLMQPCWLRLVRSEGTVEAKWSNDGSEWRTVSSVEARFSPAVRAGLVVNSGLPGLRAEVLFDKVALTDSR